MSEPYSLGGHSSSTLGHMKSGDIGAEDSSERIRFELFRRHVSASTLAILLGRDVKTVRRHLKGETPWPAGEVWQIAEYLNITVAELTGEGGHDGS